MTKEQVSGMGDGATVTLMPGTAERRLLETTADDRAAAIARLVASAPAEALSAVAFWTDVLALAEQELTMAGARARNEGYAWRQVGYAWGDRTTQAAARKFAAAAREAAGDAG